MTDGETSDYFEQTARMRWDRLAACLDQLADDAWELWHGPFRAASPSDPDLRVLLDRAHRRQREWEEQFEEKTS